MMDQNRKIKFTQQNPTQLGQDLDDDDDDDLGQNQVGGYTHTNLD